MAYYKCIYKYTHRNGNWVVYFKQTIKMYSKIPVFWKFTLEHTELNKFSFIKFIILLLIKTPWWLMIKPFGCLFHTVVKYDGYNTVNNNIIIDYHYTKKGFIFFLRFIPIWPIFGDTLNKRDKEILFKNKVIRI